LTDAWAASADRHSNEGKAYPHVFAPAKAMLAGCRVPVLVISDSNTKGLVGIADQNNDTGSSWANLVKSTGVANSSKGAGGAFGIGKMAPFACSALRTVFYQTCSKDGWGFQGVVRLMTHRDKNTDRTLQAFGMIGLKGHDKREDCEVSLPVQKRELVPDSFRTLRQPGSFGTDIFVVGFVGGDAQDLARARELLGQLCRRVEHVGPWGAGATLKLAINLPLMVYWQALGEAMSLIDDLGIDPQRSVDILSETSGGPNMLKSRGPAIAQAIATGAGGVVSVDVATLRKDLRTMLAEAASRKRELPVTAQALACFDQAAASGADAADCTHLPVWWAHTGGRKAGA
jgi:hypothetical protein